MNTAHRYASPAPASSGGFGEFFRYHGWLSPGVRLFRKITFTAKALWVGAAFVLPLLILLGFLWQSTQEQVDSTRSEQQGMRYLEPVFEVVKAAQNRRRAATVGAPDLGDAQSTVDAAFEKLAKLDKELGKALSTDKAFADVQQRQSALKGTPQGSNPDDTFKLHSDFITALLKLASDVTDNSQLSLDPELDTYHMMLIALQRGPQEVETLARLRGLGVLILNSKDLSQARRDNISRREALQPFLNGEVERSYALGVAPFPEVAKRLDMAGSQAATEAFMAAVKQQLMGNELQGSAGDYLALANTAVGKQQELYAQIAKRLAERLQERVDGLHSALWLKLGIALGFVALAAYLMMSFYRVMMGGLQEVTGHLREITNGNLTTAPRPWGSDEAAQLMLTLGDMQTALRRIVGAVLQGSAQVQTSSGEIASAAHDLSGRTEQTAANLEETAATMEQISSQVKQSGTTVQGASSIVQDNAKAATECGVVIGNVVQTMDDIRKSSNRIGEIIGVIDGIAFQTNILALNAAVEAARAGEHGRGFAVVATEVRALAGRSANAAKEIKNLISSSIAQVESGHSVVGHAGELMATIVNNAGNIATLMREITVGTQQQGQGVVEVGVAVRALDEATQQNAALVEQTAAAASGLAEQAERLNHEVSFFRLA